jgi:hypothetical protein
MTHILLRLQGTWCNDWPCFRITANNKVYYDAQIQDHQTLEFQVPDLDVNCLLLTHHGKYFGENNRWDTRVEDDAIVQDRAVQLHGLELDGVDIVKYLRGRWFQHTTDGQVIDGTYFGHNATCRIDYSTPVYDWIITELIKNNTHRKYNAQDLILETSHSDVFDYGNDRELLDEIEQLLDTHAHLFNKPSQVRNT